MKDFMIGESYTREFIVTDELIKNIAKVSGDTNPIHLDETYAEKTIFKKRIAHALFCINGISMIIGNYFPGSGSIILNQNFKYVKPVYINDFITITITITEIIKEKSQLVLECLCENQNNDIVVKAITQIRVLE